MSGSLRDDLLQASEIMLSRVRVAWMFSFRMLALYSGLSTPPGIDDVRADRTEQPRLCSPDKSSKPSDSGALDASALECKGEFIKQLLRVRSGHFSQQLLDSGFFDRLHAGWNLERSPVCRGLWL